jgi:hypothetical protein
MDAVRQVLARRIVRLEESLKRARQALGVCAIVSGGLAFSICVAAVNTIIHEGPAVLVVALALHTLALVMLAWNASGAAGDAKGKL